MREQFFPAAAAQNLKRLVRFLQPTDKTRSGSYLLKRTEGKKNSAAYAPQEAVSVR